MSNNKYSYNLNDFNNEIFVGDNIKFNISFVDFKNSLGYDCKFILTSSSNKIELTSTNLDDVFYFDINSTVTSGFTDGYYKVYAVLADTINNLQTTIEIDYLTIKKNLADVVTEDVLTHAQRMIVALELLIENKAVNDIQSYSIKDRQILKLGVKDLLYWRDYYKKEVELELNKIGNKKGKGNKIKIVLRDRYN